MSWWHFDGWPTPQEWQGVLLLATLVVAVLAGLDARRQLRAMHEGNDAANKAAIAASEANKIAAEAAIAAERPYVLVRFSLKTAIPRNPNKTAAGGWVMVEIENTGRTAATNLRMTSTPELESSGDGWPSDDPDVALRAVRSRFSGEESIALLAPGQKLSYILDTAIGMFGEGSELPQDYSVDLEYYAHDGEGEPFRETQIMDISPYASSPIFEDPLEVLAVQARFQSHAIDGIARRYIQGPGK